MEDTSCWGVCISSLVLQAANSVIAAVVVNILFLKSFIYSFAPVGRSLFSISLIPRVSFRCAPFCPGLMASAPLGRLNRGTGRDFHPEVFYEWINIPFPQHLTINFEHPTWRGGIISYRCLKRISLHTLPVWTKSANICHKSYGLKLSEGKKRYNISADKINNLTAARLIILSPQGY